MKKRALIGLIPAALLLASCSNTDSSTVSCDTVADCPNSTNATYVCKNNECVKKSNASSGNGSETDEEYDEIKVKKYCDLAYECEDGSGYKFKCVDKSCVKLVPKEKEPEDEDPDVTECSSADDCDDGSGAEFDCINNRCKKASSGNNDDDPENHQETGKTCRIAADCDDGSGSRFKCENRECVKLPPKDPDPQEDDPVEEVNLCGNGTIDSSNNEVCDGANLNGKSCKSLEKGYYAGALACSKTCLEFDESKCEECDPMDQHSHPCGEGKICKERHCVPTTCGNGSLDDGEVCDGSDLGGKTCADLNGFGEGDLKCSATCHFDTSECKLDTGVKSCSGDDDCSAGQKCINDKCKSTQLECDSMDLVNNKCSDGKVCVNNQCVAPSCGDKIKNQDSEECDGNDFGSKKCSDFEGFASGFLTCSSSCKIETTNCTASGTDDEKCSDDSECGANEKCEQGKCVAKSNDGGNDDECSKDNECGANEKCESGKCVTKPNEGGESSNAKLVISQIYGGGGNEGAPYKSKYIQILNATGNSVDLKGWSIHYASASSDNFSSTCTITTDKKLLNNRTLMVELYKGASGDADLPRVEYSCKENSKEVKIAQESGILILTSNDAKLPAVSELKKDQYVDGVGYGTAKWFEGSAAAPKLSKTTELIRKGGGCTDTDDNAADFETRAPQPPAGTLPVTCN